MKPLGENLETTIEQSQEGNLVTSEPTDTTPVESILCGRTTLISSLSIPSAPLVSLSRV